MRWWGIVAAAASIAVLGCTPMSPAAGDADPVVIVAGTGAPAAFYEPMATRLRTAGYEVSIYEIPAPFSPFEESAVGAAEHIDAVLARTGRVQVDVIAHSQGVILARYAARFLGSGPQIDVMVSLGGGIQGSDLARDLQDSAGCLGIVICTQAATGSDFIRALNDPSDAVAGIHHVNVASIHDQVATPYETSLMVGPGDITNVVVQDQCPGDPVDHITLATSGVVASGIDDALADRPVRLDCGAI